MRTIVGIESGRGMETLNPIPYTCDHGGVRGLPSRQMIAPKLEVWQPQTLNPIILG